MSVRNNIVLLGTALLLQSCAAINNPEGGPRDLENPKLVAAYPIDKSINVNTQTIRLIFDEEVKTPNLAKQLQISPNTEPKYTIKTDRNTVILTFDEPLEENTTYQFNFRDGIEDITESNKAQDLKLTFSTGLFLDSAQLSGTVRNLLTNSPEANMIVALYPEADTANIRKNKPYYFTQTTTGGTFRFTNIRAANYRIFAHRDGNNNQIYDNENEAIGYLPGPVTAAAADTGKPQEILLLTGKADTRKPFILKKEPFADNYALTYNEGIEKISIKQLTAAQVQVPYTIAPEGRMVRLFPTTAFKGGQLLLTATDSSANTTTDTVTVAFSGATAFKSPGAYKIPNTTGTIAAGQSIELQFDVPLQEIKPEAFNMVEDTIRTRTLSPAEYKLQENKTTLILTPNLTAKNNITINADSGKVISASGQPVKITPIKLNISDQLPTGSVSGSVKTTYKSYIIELISANGQVARSVSSARTFIFPNLLPGTYRFRVKIDENNNNRWEGIRKDLKTPPEKVYHHTEPVEIRANWDVEDIILEF